MKLLHDPNSFKNRFRDSVKSLPSLKEWRFANRFARKSRKLIVQGLKGFGQEVEETKDMAKLFFRLLEHKLEMENRKEPPTKEEVKEAIEQLKDLGRLSVFATISIIPGGGFSLIGLELLARKFGITSFTLVPSNFRKKKGNNSDEGFNAEEVINQLKALEAGERAD